MISATEAKWNEEQCRIEYGIFFSDDEFILLEGEPENGYVPAPKIPIASLIKEDDDGWTHIYRRPDCYTEKFGLVVVGGSTSWEGDGFIAALEAVSNKLVWIMHLYLSEVFLKVDFDGENISAVSSEYPNTYHWQIPVNNPSAFCVKP